jgi:hypothetical protein
MMETLLCYTYNLRRPYGKPVPYKKYWRAYEDVMRSLEGRPHWAKASNDKQLT